MKKKMFTARLLEPSNSSISFLLPFFIFPLIWGSCTLSNRTAVDTTFEPYVKGVPLTDLDMRYVALIPTDISISKNTWKIVLNVDMGQTKKELKKTYLTNRFGEILVFNTVTQALNYLDEHGWHKDEMLNNGFLITKE